jgi:hypothetical protein
VIHPELMVPTDLGAVVAVTWRDAYFDFDEQPLRDDYQVSTVGFVVDMDETWIHLAQERLPDEFGHRAVTHIPRSCVLRIKRLA